MQHPLLYLGLLGFAPDEELRVRHWLEHNAQQAGASTVNAVPSHPIWRVVTFQEADALLICGAGVSYAYQGHLQFKSSSQQEGAPLGLHLGELKLPFALSHPEHLAALGIPVPDCPTFDSRQDSTLLKALQYFETTLRPLRSLFALAIELTSRQHEIDSEHTYHVEHQGSLQAIVDAPGKRVFLHPGVRPVDIGADAWLRRPRSANFAPAHFVQCSLEELAWLFGQHCHGLDLPTRYSQKPIHLRRNPRVRSSLLSPRHARLLDRLSMSPASLSQLRQDLSGQASWLERDLFALYLTRAISTAAAQDGVANSSLVNPELETTGKWTLDRLGRRANTVSADLNPLF